MDVQAEAMRILMLDLEDGERLQHKGHPFEVRFVRWTKGLEVKERVVISGKETLPVIMTPVNIYTITFTELWRVFERYGGSRS